MPGETQGIQSAMCLCGYTGVMHTQNNNQQHMDKGVGGDAVAGNGKKSGKMQGKCRKCGKICDGKCGFLVMVYASPKPLCLSRRMLIW